MPRDWSDTHTVTAKADRKHLFEEAPPAYKSIERVVGDLVEHGLVRVVAKLRPVVSYKTRREEQG